MKTHTITITEPEAEELLGVLAQYCEEMDSAGEYQGMDFVLRQVYAVLND